MTLTLPPQQENGPLHERRAAFALLIALSACAVLAAVMTYRPSREVRRVEVAAAANVPPVLFASTTTSAATDSSHVAAPVISRSRPPAVSRGSGAVGGGGSLARIRACESGGNYNANTGNGFYGAYQFDRQTAASVGLNWGNASPAEQDAAAARLMSQRGSAPWPVCGRR